MTESIFRKQALDSLANPEGLDAPVRLVAPVDWLALVGFVVLAVVAAVWATFTFAPIRISGHGILIDRAGLSEVVADTGGTLSTFLVAPGATVVKGQVIATLSRAELERDIADTRARLVQARARRERLETFYRQQRESEARANTERIAGIARTRDELQKHLVFLDEHARRVASLVPKGVVRRDAQIDAEAAAAAARERVATLNAEVDQIRLDANKRDGESRLALLDARNGMEDLEREEARLRARTADQTSIRAQVPGRIVEVKAAVGDVVMAGAPIATIAQSGRARELVAVLYVPAGEGKRTQPNMRVEVSPATVERSVYGSMVGTVTTVSPLPATREGMRRTLRNDELVGELVAGGAVVEVRVALLRDPGTRTGYKWTASQGPDRGIDAGTLTAGRIVVDRRRIISWLRPSGT